MHTHIIYRKELFIKVIIYVLVCGMLGVLSTYLLKSRGLSIILLIILVIPIPFMRMLLKRFTKKIFIQLHPDYFSFEIINSDGSEIQSKLNLNEVKAYCIQIPNDKFNSIKFWLINGKSFEYSFFQKKRYDEDEDTAELIDAFHKMINEYNNNPNNAIKIIFKPSFYGSKAGLFCIIGLSCAFVLAILLFSLYNAKSLPVTFVFSIILIFQLILKRKKELDYFKKIVTP